MIPEKSFAPKRLLLLASIFVFCFIKVNAQNASAAGKAVFTAKCASCHIMGRDFTGPNLQGVLDRWGNKDDIKKWILNWKKTVAAGKEEAVKVASFSQTEMQIFE